MSRLPDIRWRWPALPALPAVFVTLLTLLTLGALGSGCSTTYQPQRPGRVGLVIHRGMAMYVKDGHESPLGPLGGDLERLVAETPAAAASAHRARNQLTVGVPSYVGGLGGVVVGLALATPVGWVIAGVGAALAGTGLGFMGAGVTNAIDAVNRHNDAAPTLHARP